MGEIHHAEHLPAGMVIFVFLLITCAWAIFSLYHKELGFVRPARVGQHSTQEETLQPFAERFWVFSSLWVPVVLWVAMFATSFLWESTKMGLPEVLAVIAIAFALVSLIDIRKVHYAAEEALKAQTELKDEVVGRLGADYVKAAVSLYGQGKDVIISVTRNWGYNLSEDLQNAISDSLRKALHRNANMKIWFSGPIYCGEDFPKIMWRWKLVSDLKTKYRTDTIYIVHHPALDVVFTVVDDKMLVGWRFKDKLYGQIIPDPQTASFFKAISERMLNIDCPVKSQWPMTAPNRPIGTCLPLGVQGGKQVIQALIKGCDVRPMYTEAVLDHLTTWRRNTASEDQFEFKKNVRDFLTMEMGATFNGQGLSEVIVLP